MTTRRLKLVQSVLAGLTVLSASAELQDVLPGHYGTWLALLTGAGSAGVGYYTAHVGDMPDDDPGRHAVPGDAGA